MHPSRPSRTDRLSFLPALLVLSLALAPFPAASQAPAQDLSGRWTFTVVTENGTGTPRVVLEQAGERVTGTYASDRMGTRRLEGTVRADTLTFRLAPAEGAEVILTFTGTVQADGSLAGAADFGGMGGATFTARREEP